MKITTEEENMILQTLKESGHWYIVTVWPEWNHPLNEVPNCLAITFDGSIQLKCETLGEGNLRVAQLPYDNHFFHADKMDLKIGDELTVLELCRKIWDNPFHLIVSKEIVGRKYIQNMTERTPIVPEFLQ